MSREKIEGEEPEASDICRVRCIHQDRVELARASSPPAHEVERLAAFFGALGDPTRLSLVLALAGGEMCVCDLAAFLGCTDSAVSHHLRRLKEQALVRRRREGQMLYYSLNDSHVNDIISIGRLHVGE